MYWKKTWKYGNRVDVKKYNTFRCPGKGGAGRGERVKPTTEQMAAVNEWNAKKKLKRILIANFEFGDWHLTLTYAPDRRPDVEGSRACLRKFFEKLRKRYRECGKELKYVVVTEWERKAIHHHLAVNDLPGLNKVLAELWPHGGIRLVPMYQDREYGGLADYFVKETSKTFRRKDNPYKKRWSCSRNLVRPEETVEKVKADSWRKTPEVPKELREQGYVLDTDSIVLDVDVFGYPFLEYTLIRHEGGGGNRGRKV